MSNKYRVSMEIGDDPDIDAQPVVLSHGVVEDVPTIWVSATNWPANAEGALAVADLLRDAAEAITKELASTGQLTHDQLAKLRKPGETVLQAERRLMQSDSKEEPKRPRFNPQPRGPRKDS